MNNNTNSIETFVHAKVRPEYQPLFGAFRSLIAKDFPQLHEEMRGGTEAYYGVPVYRLNRIVISVSPTKEGITFSFSEGKSFDDKFGLLEGAGNKTRNIRLKSVDEFDVEKMRYYIQQAVDAD